MSVSRRGGGVWTFFALNVLHIARNFKQIAFRVRTIIIIVLCVFTRIKHG